VCVCVFVDERVQGDLLTKSGARAIADELSELVGHVHFIFSFLSMM
jgi:hypothetical protein